METKPAHSFATAQVHAGYTPDPTTRAVVPPIYASSAFTFDSAQHIEDIMSQKVKAFVYSRIGNPSNSVFEERIAALEGGIGAVATSSGQAATMLAVLAIAKAGDSFVLPYKLYGGTFYQFFNFFPRIGIKTTFVDSLDPADFEKAIDETTKGIIIESISNPVLEIPDIKGFSEVCKRHKIPLIVDNTFGAGGYLIKPIDHGADIVIESATKWLNGLGTVLGGVVVDSGRFDWAASGRFPEFTEPLPGYHGMVLSRDCGPMSLVVKMRMETLRETGCCLSPMVAFEILNGMSTLSLRMDKCTANAVALAQFLDKHPGVAWVSHPSLPSHPSHELAKTMLPRGSGGMVSFGVKGDDPGALGRAMIDALGPNAVPKHCANVGDVRTLVVCPAVTVQRQLSKEQLLKSGAPDDLIRVSCGIEDPADIIADFARAIEAVTGVKGQ